MGQDSWKDKDIRFKALEPLDTEKRKLQSAIIDKAHNVLDRLHSLELQNLWMLEALCDLFQDWYLNIKTKKHEYTAKDFQSMTNSATIIQDKILAYKKYIIDPDNISIPELEKKDTVQLINHTEEGLKIIKESLIA
jgi:hypothetical protein